jgi:hypothetical protein
LRPTRRRRAHLVPVTRRLALLDADRGDVDTAGLARIVTADPAIPGRR